MTFADDLAALNADAVYFLLHPGWEDEARANRWHFATRWARHLPVVLVVPEQRWPRQQVEAEARIVGASLLYTLRGYGGAPSSRESLLRAGQVLHDMRVRGVKRPILWAYNAAYAELFALAPAVARLHHVTENYFDFPSPPDYYLDRLRFVAETADLNIAVSDGCANPLKAFLSSDRLSVVTNGCDFAAYSECSSPDAEAVAAREGFTRLAVFAGNVNNRLDFELCAAAADRCPGTLMLFVGRVSLGGHARAAFRRLISRRNVRSLGAVDPDRLPGIYLSADLGFIPYQLDPLLVENGFPLKALEMAACGLPVVSTLMKPLLPLSPPLVVASSAESFLAAFARAGREPQVTEALVNVARAGDYDTKFSAIASMLAARAREGARVDELARWSGISVGRDAARFWADEAIAPRTVAREFMNGMIRSGAALMKRFARHFQPAALR